MPLPGPSRASPPPLVWVYALWGAFRLSRHLLRRLLWRIRSKLILSYLFIALVPVLLLTLLFFIASVLGSILVAGHLVNERLAEAGRELRAASEGALSDLPRDEREAAAALVARLSGLRLRHPGLAVTLIRRGRAIARQGEAPRGPARVVGRSPTSRVWPDRETVPTCSAPSRGGEHGAISSSAPRPEAVRGPGEALAASTCWGRARSRRSREGSDGPAHPRRRSRTTTSRACGCNWRFRRPGRWAARGGVAASASTG